VLQECSKDPRADQRMSKQSRNISQRSNWLVTITYGSIQCELRLFMSECLCIRMSIVV
jgi:hypothetical protein